MSYYKTQPKIIIDLIENLIWLGMSNLYGAFDTNISLAYLNNIIELLSVYNVDLPSALFLSQYPVEDEGGWGKTQKFPNLDELGR